MDSVFGYVLCLSVFSVYCCHVIIKSINLPDNSFKKLIRLLAFTDLVLALISIPLALEGLISDEPVTRCLLLLSRALFDASFFLSFSIGLIAFYIVKLQGSVSVVSWKFLAAVGGGFGILHIILLEIIGNQYLYYVNYLNCIIYTCGYIIFLIFTIGTLQQLQQDKKQLIRISESPASTLMKRLMISITVWNTLSWIPVIVGQWIFLNTDLSEPGTILHTGYLVSLSVKGAIHAAAVLIVLGKKQRDCSQKSLKELRDIKKGLDLVLGHKKQDLEKGQEVGIDTILSFDVVSFKVPPPAAVRTYRYIDTRLTFQHQSIDSS